MSQLSQHTPPAGAAPVRAVSISSLTVSPESIPADGITPATFTATVTNNGAPAAGETVTWRIISGYGQVTPSSSVTNGSGLATTQCTSTIPGTTYVQATCNGTTMSAGVSVNETAAAVNIGNDFTLNAAGYMCALGRPPLNVPGNAKHIQQATGGFPPYTYSTSNPQMAHVNPVTGEVTVGNNGVCLITATDSSGAADSYQLTVTGAEVFIGTGALLTWEEAVAVGTQSLATFKQFFTTYSSESCQVHTLLGWPGQDYYWTSDEESSTYARVAILNITAPCDVNSVGVSTAKDAVWNTMISATPALLS